MNYSCRAMLALAISIPLLGSCALFSKSPIAKQSRSWVPKQHDPAAYAQSQVAVGREALAQQQYGLAIACFRTVQQFPDHAPDAYNGLGIAYANLGRPDLAERYFSMAVAARPSDKRFAANLALLKASLGEQRIGNAAPPADIITLPTVGTDKMAPNPALALLAEDRSSPRQVRLSPREVALTAPRPVRLTAQVAADVGTPETTQRTLRRSAVQYPLKIAMGRASAVDTTGVRRVSSARYADQGANRLGRLSSAPAIAEPRGRDHGYPIRLIIRNPYVNVASVSRITR